MTEAYYNVGDLFIQVKPEFVDPIEQDHIYMLVYLSNGVLGMINLSTGYYIVMLTFRVPAMSSKIAIEEFNEKTQDNPIMSGRTFAKISRFISKNMVIGNTPAL
ncbi:hypothetical protein GXP67_21075 [Rhodocytophaga rosea]|uniref:Uncharacterized protein n=1 Tax=Rhodocytophaga rosea TaxID=2704465 RepID=A0A6C0GMV1_9BACT|nr:hypothetical protein [Rhodocytophaga rosea]QHT68963.1 hypothetical protein GXP67_21075 [Rhodocytophaga rosea]